MSQATANAAYKTYIFKKNITARATCAAHFYYTFILYLGKVISM